MKFYNRQLETKRLLEIEKISHNFSQMTIITGRRRIGKTSLIKHAFENKTYLYFFVAKKSEALTCRELSHAFLDILGEDLGDFTELNRLFSAIMQLAKRRHITLVFDEFQNFKFINESFFSDMQNIWDSNKDEAKINLILSGSLYSMMTKIFDDAKEPLYGRATARLKLKAFSLKTLGEILSDNNPSYTPDDLLAFYMISGGVAKYVEQLVMNKAFTKDRILKYVLSYGSYFIDEGRELLSDEFGKDYGNYFSVMSAIASGYNTRNTIEPYTGISAGGYLEKLEKTYDLIYRYRPYLASEGTQNVKFGINDNFLNFWFRFIYKYRSAVEIGNLDYVLDKVKNDYNTYSGIILERYCRQLYCESGLYNIVTNYWEKDGKNEIDLVAVNEADKVIVIGECKRQLNNISLTKLKEKATNIMNKQKKFDFDFVAFSLDNLKH